MDGNGVAALVPLQDELGNRLIMHQSDRIYFGGTLKYRRNASFKQCNFSKFEDLILELARIDRQEKEIVSNKVDVYRYTQFFKSTVSSTYLTQIGYRTFEPEVICEIEFEVR